MVNHTFKLALTALLLWLIVVAGQMGYANLYYFNANNHLEKWIDLSNIDSEASYRQALRAINTSISYHPANPQYIETLGSIQEWAVFSDYAEVSNFSLALKNYNQAIQLRPIWPWGWSSKAMAKWSVEELDVDLFHSLVMLDKYGSYIEKVHLVIVDIGLMLIVDESSFADQVTPLVMKHYRRGMTNNSKAITEVITSYKAEELVAGW